MKKWFLPSLSLVIFAGFLLTSCSEDMDVINNMELNNTARFDNYKKMFESVYGKIDPAQEWDFTKTATRAGKGTDKKNQQGIVLEGYTTTGDMPVAEVNNVHRPADLGSQFCHATDDKFTGKTYNLVSNGRFFFMPYWHADCDDYVLFVEVYDQLAKEGQAPKAVYMATQGDMVYVMSDNYKNWSNDRMLEKETSGDNNQCFSIATNKGDEIVMYIANAYEYSQIGTSIMSNNKDFVDRVEKAYVQLAKGKNKDIVYFSDAILFDEWGDKADGVYNDLVVLVSETDDYQPEIIEKDIEIEKRYMVEDLGSETKSSDIDFNDIVVDIKKTIYQKIILGEVVEEKTKSLYLSLRAIGGTMNFQFCLIDPNDSKKHTVIFEKQPSDGNYKWGKFDWEIAEEWNKDNGFIYSKPYNVLPSEYNPERETKGMTTMATCYIADDPAAADLWDPEKNNIRFIVTTNKPASGDFIDEMDIYTHSYILDFPKTGEAPAIVAFDPIKVWQPESVGIPVGTEWFVNENNPKWWKK